MSERELVYRANSQKKSVETCVAFSREVEAAQAVDLRVNSVGTSGHFREFQPTHKCPSVPLDFDKEDIWAKKTVDKKLFPDKFAKKDLDFAPVPTLYPAVNQIMERVDRDNDGTLSDSEIARSLNGSNLNEKEKHTLEMLQKNKSLIDEDRDGISLRDIKEFDAKIVQYNKELAMSRKFAPELAEFARALYQHGKMIDDDRDGKFSRKELQNFYHECKKEFLLNPSEDGKRELLALGWGISNYDRFALMPGYAGAGQITMGALRSQALREFDRGMPREWRDQSLSQSDRFRIERYRQNV